MNLFCFFLVFKGRTGERSHQDTRWPMWSNGQGQQQSQAAPSTWPSTILQWQPKVRPREFELFIFIFFFHAVKRLKGFSYRLCVEKVWLWSCALENRWLSQLFQLAGFERYSPQRVARDDTFQKRASSCATRPVWISFSTSGWSPRPSKFFSYHPAPFGAVCSARIPLLIQLS